MFQPEWKQSNDFTQPNCDDRVTPCNERQVVCEKATTTQNNKCACNHTAGYKPRETSGCKCFSQDSLCECEKAACKEGEFLSPDYQCHLSQSSDSTKTPSEKNLIIGLSVGVFCLIAVTVLSWCCYKHRNSSNCKRTDENKDKGTDVNEPLTSQPRASLSEKRQEESKTEPETPKASMSDDPNRENTKISQEDSNSEPIKQKDILMGKTDVESDSNEKDNNASTSDASNRESTKKRQEESNNESKKLIDNTKTVYGVGNEANLKQAITAAEVHGDQGNRQCPIIKAKREPLPGDERQPAEDIEMIKTDDEADSYETDNSASTSDDSSSPKKRQEESNNESKKLIANTSNEDKDQLTSRGKDNSKEKKQGATKSDEEAEQLSNRDKGKDNREEKKKGVSPEADPLVDHNDL